MKSQKIQTKKMTGCSSNLESEETAYYCKLIEHWNACTLDIGPEILRPRMAQKLDAIAFSDNIIQRIIDVAKYIEKQTAKGIKRSTYFVIQLDKSSDVREHAILLCFMRYSEDERFREEPLYCLDLSGQTTSSEISSVLNEYF